MRERVKVVDKDGSMGVECLEPNAMTNLTDRPCKKKEKKHLYAPLTSNIRLTTL